MKDSMTEMDARAESSRARAMRALEALRSRMEDADAAERESAAQSLETVEALRRRVKLLEEMLRERDEGIRKSEKERLETLERVKRAEARGHAAEAEARVKDERAKRAEAVVEALRMKTDELEIDLESAKRDARDLERQVDAYRDAARAAEDGRVAAELEAAKSEARAKEYLATPEGRDRIRLEHRIGALSEKLRDLTSRESKVISRFRRALRDEIDEVRARERLIIPTA